MTNVERWYGTQFTPSTQPTPALVVGSLGAPGHDRTAISPTWPASAAWRWPGALDAAVTTSIRPGTSGSPALSYEGPVGSLDCPLPARKRIIEIGRTDWYFRLRPQAAMAASCTAPLRAK